MNSIELAIRLISICFLIWGLVVTFGKIKYRYNAWWSFKHFFNYLGELLETAEFRLQAPLLILSVVQIWAVVRLFHATSLKTDMEAALYKAICWRRISVTIIILYIILFFCYVNYVIVGIHILVLATFVTIVSKYMSQLDMYLHPKIMLPPMERSRSPSPV